MSESLRALHDNLTTRILGAGNAADLVLIGLLAEGHVLIQGPPGTGKTTLARTVALSLQSTFHRIQFTSDLLPAEIIGYNLLDQASGRFVLHQGPIFSRIILADEINRASPRTQSALLEAMQERQVSIDGITYPLERPFFVMATENHLSSAGTFPLPDSLLDRFLLSFEMPRPDAAARVDILAAHASGEARREVQAAMSESELTAIQDTVRAVHVARPVMQYIVTLGDAVAGHHDVATPASTRALIGLQNAARGHAFLKGRDAVYPDDVKAVFPFVLRHRVVLKTDARRHPHAVERLLNEIRDTTPVPLASASV